MKHITYKGGDIRQKFQGDISFIKVDKAEVAFSSLPQEGLVLAEGETTGHRHLLVADKDAVVEISKDREGYFINVKSGRALVKHEEHEVQVLNVGIYFSGRQWEYSEIDEGRVQD